MQIALVILSLSLILGSLFFQYGADSFSVADIYAAVGINLDPAHDAEKAARLKVIEDRIAERNRTLLTPTPVTPSPPTAPTASNPSPSTSSSSTPGAAQPVANTARAPSATTPTQEQLEKLENASAKELSGWMGQVSDKVKDALQEANPMRTVHSIEDKVEQMNALSKLYDGGQISEDEFLRMRRELGFGTKNTSAE